MHALTTGPHCVMPPAPELLERITRAKAHLDAGEKVAARATQDSVDLVSLAKILARPPQTRAETFTAPVRDQAAIVGTRQALVLLVDFADSVATETQAHFAELLFSLGTYATGSLRDFYQEASYGQLDVTGLVSGTGGPTAGWFRAPQNKSYYTNGNYGFGGHPNNAQKLVEDVVAAADAHVNFADFDNDGDGTVDALVIIAAGTGAEVTGDTNDIWSHKWQITPQNRDGVTISRYFMAPEDGRVGVMAHELGHLLLGLPDLYDTDYSSSGTGRWDLMAGGSWNDGGDRPAHPTAWCKLKAGWIAPTVLHNAAQNVTIPPYDGQGTVYKLPVGAVTSTEYFLVSNRQQSGFDDHLPGEGLVIEHCDDSLTSNTDENHYLVDVEQADGQRHLNLGTNSGDSTDPFPTSTSAAFDASTTPNSLAYDGSDPQIAVTSIARSGNDVTASISVGGAAARQWVYNVKVTATFAHFTTSWAWAHLDGYGWRRVQDGAADGVSNMFDALCEAVATGHLISADIDGAIIYTMYLL